MRILHVIPSLTAAEGGPAAAVVGMTRGIADQGANVTVATTASGDRGSEVRLAASVTIERFPRTLPGSWKYSRGLGHWLRDNAGTFDVMHVHALFSYSTIPACRSAISAGVPLVVRPLGSLDEWSMAQGTWKKRPYLRLVETRHLEAAGAIHVTSELERRDVAALGYGAKVRLIPLGVSAVASEPDVRTRRELRGPLAPINVLFLGRLHPAKRVPLLIEAAQRLQETQCSLRIAGSGSEPYVRELKRLSRPTVTGSSIELIGHVNGPKKDELFQWADVLVLPSEHESFGLAAAEAMAAGVPVILSDNVGLAPEAREAGAAVVFSNGVAGLETALTRVARDPDLRLRMALNGRALAERRFTWPRVSRSLIELYEELTHGRPRR